MKKLVVVFLILLLAGSSILFYNVQKASAADSTIIQLTKTPDNDWPMFHHDAGRSGYSTSTAPMTNQTLWSYVTGGAVSSSPAVVNGIVYFGSADGSLYALIGVS